MNVVDSSGWLEFFARGPNAGFFRTPILDTEALIVPVLTLYEVYKLVLRQRNDEYEARIAIVNMQQGDVIELDTKLALEAARLSIDLRLPMADSIILATARAYGATLWTQDAHFEGIEGIRFVARNAR